MSAFQATYWNFTQTMAWVFLGDRRLVERADEEVWEFGSFVTEVVTPDGERKLIDVQSDPPNSLTMTLLAAARGGAAYPTYTDAERALIKTL